MKGFNDFVAIDFETANGNRSSICSVGLVIVRNGEIVDKYYSLVKPTPNYYAWFCQEVHGLGYEDTDNAPIFPKVWAEIEDLLARDFQDLLGDTSTYSLLDRADKISSWVPFVAHNARFDQSCLNAAFRVYQMERSYNFFDTLWYSRRHFGKSLPNHQLHIVAAACGYDLKNHHHALADAEACAWIAREIAYIE